MDITNIRNEWRVASHVLTLDSASSSFLLVALFGCSPLERLFVHPFDSFTDGADGEEEFPGPLSTNFTPRRTLHDSVSAYPLTDSVPQFPFNAPVHPWPLTPFIRFDPNSVPSHRWKQPFISVISHNLSVCQDRLSRFPDSCLTPGQGPLCRASVLFSRFVVMWCVHSQNFRSA